jgi:hypothetical protein
MKSLRRALRGRPHCAIQSRGRSCLRPTSAKTSCLATSHMRRTTTNLCTLFCQTKYRYDWSFHSFSNPCVGVTESEANLSLHSYSRAHESAKRSDIFTPVREKTTPHLSNNCIFVSRFNSPSRSVQRGRRTCLLTWLSQQPSRHQQRWQEVVAPAPCASRGSKR